MSLKFSESRGSCFSWTKVCVCISCCVDFSDTSVKYAIKMQGPTVIILHFTATPVLENMLHFLFLFFHCQIKFLWLFYYLGLLTL